MYGCYSRVLCASFFVLLGMGLDARGAGFPVAWGTSAFGVTNPPPELTNVIAIAAGPYHNLAVLDGGAIAGWGDNSFGKATSPGIGGVVAVAAGANHSLALRRNGRVVAWGDGTATNVPPGLIDVMRIAAGEFHSLALRSNGVVVGWGANNFGQVNPQAETFVAVAAGANHSLGLRANGTVAAWGHNGFGQSTVPGTLNGVIAIAAGDRFSMALRNNGTVVTWGMIASPPAHSGVVSIAAGAAHWIARRNDRTVFCWGDNSLNQSVVPPGTTNVIGIAAGASHTVALRMAPPRITEHPTPRTVLQGESTTFSATFKGSLPLRLQWRFNDNPIPNATNATHTITAAQSSHAGLYSLLVSNAVGTAASSNALLTVNVPVSITEHPQSVAVPIGGTARFDVTAVGTPPIRFQWQREGTNLVPGGAASYTIFPVTTNHAGNYRVIVSNDFNVATSMVATLTVLPLPIIRTQPQNQSVLVGGTASFSVVADHAEGYQWSKNNIDIPGANEATYTISNVHTNDAGTFHVAVTNQQGSVKSTGATLAVNALPPGESVVVQWGENPVFNGFDQIDITVPDGLIQVSAIAAGEYHNLVLLRDGRVFGWGDNLFGQASPPPTATNIIGIAAGTHHSAAVTGSGNVLPWGRNNLRQLDIPPGLSGVAALAAGAHHTLALRSNGTVVAWGHTNAGQVAVPSNLTNVMAIAAGFEHSMALLSNGTLRTWGNNDFGQRVPPFPLSNLVAIAGGRYHSVALRNDGRVFAWGQNTFQQTNVPPDANDVIAIAAGANHSMALRRDGRVICWGHNNFLQLQPPEGLSNVVGIAAAGYRSLALKSKRMRLEPPMVTNGSVRLRIVNADGSAVDPGLLSRVEVYASSNPALPRDQWTKRNITWSMVNGGFEGNDPAPLASARFYIAVERP